MMACERAASASYSDASTVVDGREDVDASVVVASVVVASAGVVLVGRRFCSSLRTVSQSSKLGVLTADCDGLDIVRVSSCIVAVGNVVCCNKEKVDKDPDLKRTRETNEGLSS